MLSVQLNREISSYRKPVLSFLFFPFCNICSVHYITVEFVSSTLLFLIALRCPPGRAISSWLGRVCFTIRGSVSSLLALKPSCSACHQEACKGDIMYGDVIVMSLVINISIKIISLQSVISRYIISASSLAEIF